MKNKQYPFSMKLWLWIGLFMVFIQVMIGGITRLTDAGLSMTEWEVVRGVVPPLNAAQWEETFQNYKTDARKQYETLHPDMTLSEFKYIYFWEYFHRMWGRLMGIVFIIPFFYYLFKKQIDPPLLKKLLIVLILASLAGIFGWIMVKSGLNSDERTWVSAYKLMIHLIIALATFSAIYWTIASITPMPQLRIPHRERNSLRIVVYIIFTFTILQILIGGLMAGMRAGLLHPYWPVFVNGDSFLQALTNVNSFSTDDLLNYEPSVFVKAWVQLIHRITAYILVGLSIILLFFARSKSCYKKIKPAVLMLLILIIIQASLGIITIINSIGSIPAVLGVLHQLTAFIFIGVLLHILYLVNTSIDVGRVP